MPVPAHLCSMLGLLCVLALHLTSAHGEIIYDNSDPNAQSIWAFQNNYIEYGDEIILGGTNRVLTQFQLAYYGAFQTNATVAGEVWIYKNDGPKTPDGISTPGTVLFDSGPFSVATGYATWTSSALNVVLPDDITWAVRFSGLTGTNTAGILFSDPPTVGSSYNDAWLDVGNTWETVQFPGSIANFSARLISDQPRVSIRRDGGQVIVEWTGLSILQEADEVTGQFQDKPEFRNVYRFTTSTAPRKFWRLRD